MNGVQREITGFLKVGQTSKSNLITDFSLEVKIRRALGPMARKIACGPSKLILSGPAGPANFEAAVIQL